MYEESDTPMIDIDVMLLDLQEPYVGVVGDVFGRYSRH
jgi:hypothetical protein